MSSLVTVPSVIASCSADTLFSNTVKLVTGGCAGSVQLAMVERCRGVSPRRSGAAASCRATAVTRAISEPAAGTFASAAEYTASLHVESSASRAGMG